MDRDTFVRRAALTGVVISATVLSYMTLRHRAVTIGIPENASWFYPILFDAFILGASRMWQNQALSDSTRQLAKILTLSGIVAALLAFVAEFWPKGLVAVGFSLIIPAVMASALVLTSRAAADRKSTSETVTDVSPEPTAAPVPEVTPEPVAAKVEGNTVVPDEAIPMKPMGAGALTNAAPVTVKEVEETTISKIQFAPEDEITAWINDMLDQGIAVTGKMAKERFPQLKGNASRKVASVKAKREKVNGTEVKV